MHQAEMTKAAVYPGHIQTDGCLLWSNLSQAGYWKAEYGNTP